MKKERVMKINFVRVTGEYKEDLVALFDLDASDEEISKVVKEGANSKEVIVITKEQFKNVFQVKG